MAYSWDEAGWDGAFGDDVESGFFGELEVVADRLADADVLRGDEGGDLGENAGSARVGGDDLHDAPVHDRGHFPEMAGGLEFFEDAGELRLSADDGDGGEDDAAVDVEGPREFGVRQLDGAAVDLGALDP